MESLRLRCFYTSEEAAPLLQCSSESHRSVMKLSALREWLDGRRLALDCLAAVFGIGSWVAVNGLWVELPLLVQKLPEGWSLPSYLSVIIQIANLGPLLYGLLSRLAPHVVTPARATWVTLAVGVAASTLMPIFWSETAVVFGQEHSVALFSLSLALSLVDCTSSVLYLPYVGLFRSIYLPSYLFGEGLSALLPSLVATVQGVGKSTCVNSTDPEWPGLVEKLEPPLFSTEVFFVTLAVMMGMSTLAFAGMEFLPLCKRERVAERAAEKEREDDPTRVVQHGTSALILILGLQCWMSFWANGSLVSLITYSCLPYGNVAYHWAAILFNTANPLACVLALYKPCLSLRGLVGLVGTGSTVSVYLLWTAATSPSPPLVESAAGGYVVVFAWFLYSALTCYAKVSAACVLRQSTWKLRVQSVEPRHSAADTDSDIHHSKEVLSTQRKLRSEAENRLFFYGVATQAGSLVGSVITFVLVNIVALFTASYPCQSE